MWKYGSRIIKEGRAWTDDEGFTHPRLWMRWSAERKAQKGLVWHEPEVKQSNSEEEGE
tara:strand:+ start:2574 stop:2747 length:174 start_codon:yes stop_codon:yes gene_type:complete